LIVGLLAGAFVGWAVSIFFSGVDLLLVSTLAVVCGFESNIGPVQPQLGVRFYFPLTLLQLTPTLRKTDLIQVRNRLGFSYGSCTALQNLLRFFNFP